MSLEVERLEAAHRLRDLAAELEDFEALQASLEFLESHLQGDELESVREERIMSAESEGKFELAATVLQEGVRIGSSVRARSCG